MGKKNARYYSRDYSPTFIVQLFLCLAIRLFNLFESMNSKLNGKHENKNEMLAFVFQKQEGSNVKTNH